MPTPKERLDVLLVDRGLAASRAQAQALVRDGQVRVGGQPAAKPGMSVAADAALEVQAALPYVSRGGLKLAHALHTFGLAGRVAGQVALDAGASTGGFTDVLLQAGAARVYAIDVGTAQLAASLRADPRVVVCEGTNIRYLDALPDAPDLAVADLAFISLRLVVPVLLRLTQPAAWLVLLVKPQFEAGKGQVGKGGVVRDRAVWAAVLARLSADWQAVGLTLYGLTRSPLLGPAGNVEFLAYLEKHPLPDVPPPDTNLLIANVLPDL